MEKCEHDGNCPNLERPSILIHKLKCTSKQRIWMSPSDFSPPTIPTAASGQSKIRRYNLPNTNNLTYGTEEVYTESVYSCFGVLTHSPRPSWPHCRTLEHNMLRGLYMNKYLFPRHHCYSSTTRKHAYPPDKLTFERTSWIFGCATWWIDRVLHTCWSHRNRASGLLAPLWPGKTLGVGAQLLLKVRP